MSTVSIDRELGKLWDSHWDTMLNASVKAGKRLLLVEGDDDKIIVEQLLEAVDTLWSKAVYVGVAGDRGKVLTRLERHPDWYGLVDRDVWDDSEVASKKAILANLEITEGWCIENHFCAPRAVESALDLPAGCLQAIVDPQLDGWMCYGAIWWELQRLRERFASALPTSDLGHPLKDACDPSRDGEVLRARLEHYGALLGACNVDSVVAGIQERKRRIDAMAGDAKIGVGVHGKRFFNEVMGRALNKVIGQRRSGEWRPYVAARWKTWWPDYLKRFASCLLK